MRSTVGRSFTRLHDALGWRFRNRLGDERVDRAIVNIAARWRRILDKSIFIGIAGSAGKTTAKELLLGLLASKLRGIGSSASLNKLPEVAKTILRVRRTHGFCVVELSEDRPGEMDQELALLQPGIGIVTVVGNDHWSAYGSHDAIAAEIGKLVAALPATGTAVLNADDERVIAMGANCAAKVISYGTSPHAELRAEDIGSAWPDRLQLTLVRGAERVRLATQLCGAHWVPAVLGAVGGGLAAGLSLTECADGIARVAPFDGRMQPVTTPDGVTFIRDDFKAPLWTVDACFDFMKAARAQRKIIVIGEISDIGPKKGNKYAKIATLAQEFADMVVFVGPWAPSVLTARKPGRDGALRAFGRVRDAAAYIGSITRAGDLILLKGTHTQDHLRRIILARTDDVACWRDDCKRHVFCDKCPDRLKPSGAPLLLQREPISEAPFGNPRSPADGIGNDEQVIVGLGNPDSKRSGTPHNIGYEVVNRLADSWGLAWETTPDAWIARGLSKERRVCLVKIRTSMNRIGAGLQQLSERHSFKPEQCILVYDDLDLPIGSVRTRLSGGAGGHNGVASILEAFQTDAFRRVKVGIGQPGAKLDLAQYLLTPFDEAGRAAAALAVASAVVRTVEMVSAHPRASSPTDDPWHLHSA